MPLPALNFLSRVVLGMPVARAAELTVSPASARALRVLSATAAAYSVLSISSTLMPIWAGRKSKSTPISTVALPLLVRYTVRMDMNEAVAKAISAERNVAGLTVRKLAELAGIPERSLMRVLQAERDIKVNQVEQIAHALRLYPHEIIERAEIILERSTRQPPTLRLVDYEDISDVSGDNENEFMPEDQAQFGLAARAQSKDRGYDIDYRED